MTTRLATWGTLPLWCVRAIGRQARAHAHRRLTDVYRTAGRVPFDDTSRIVFFGDCHRGDSGRADAFAKNKGLFLHALCYYFRHGFTYVEVGDGDELWQNQRFGDVRRAHGRVFDLFHEFDCRERLHLVVGNHDLQDCRRPRLEKDGIPTCEGLVLDHVKTGQQLFVVHGHQADFASDRLCVVSRRAVRAFKHLQRMGVARRVNVPSNIWQPSRIDRWIVDWVRSRRQAAICGHTHRPACAVHGTPYFNTGSCLVPGAITGLELEAGLIRLVRWTAQPGREGGAMDARREAVSPPRALRSFA